MNILFFMVNVANSNTSQYLCSRFKKFEKQASKTACILNKRK